jgi:hypothetical protein
MGVFLGVGLGVTGEGVFPGLVLAGVEVGVALPFFGAGVGVMTNGVTVVEGTVVWVDAGVEGAEGWWERLRTRKTTINPTTRRASRIK